MTGGSSNVLLFQKKGQLQNFHHSAWHTFQERTLSNNRAFMEDICNTCRRTLSRTQILRKWIQLLWANDTKEIDDCSPRCQNLTS